MRGRLILALCLTLALGAPALAQTPGPAEVIADLYKPVPDPDPDAEPIEEAPDEPSLYAAGLRALLAIDAQRDMNYLDFDWVSGGQDLADYRNLKIVVLKQTAETAQVRVTFRNYSEARERLIDMVVEDGRWVIEDVYMKTPEKEWLSRRLVANPQD
ncbi:DUF3828 domain-containing protein [Caulobacter sp. NIBR1757]|uniref:DUF3828 domain-containing protein n=1 Tax=Caulobacter sp. NIBR1757 TaxID=3016000 RepID=UPI0022F08004|nr:DUF3828 domain-containing protein [Caulobacter sp. NIBR1757]WGM39225.1 hypothetical protein AMEJIAPC_02141 [Caulobacter sp. NIBR1757]